MNVANRGIFPLQRSIKGGENSPCTVDPITSRRLRQRDDTGLFEPVHGTPGGCIGNAQSLADFTDGPEWVLDEKARYFLQPRRQRLSEVIAPGIEQDVEVLDTRERIVRLHSDTAQKVDQPVFPRARLGNREQMSIVGLAGLLEIRTQIEQRRGQNAGLGQQKRDQQPANPSIAIEKKDE